MTVPEKHHDAAFLQVESSAPIVAQPQGKTEDDAEKIAISLALYMMTRCVGPLGFELSQTLDILTVKDEGIVSQYNRANPDKLILLATGLWR